MKQDKTMKQDILAAHHANKENRTCLQHPKQTMKAGHARSIPSKENFKAVKPPNHSLDANGTSRTDLTKHTTRNRRKGKNHY